jgi:TonB family protein
MRTLLGRTILGVMVMAATADASAQTPSDPVPIVPLHTLVLPDDYPIEAIKLKQQGKLRVRLNIGPDGQVRTCSIIETSLSKSLDAISCEIMRTRARFIPAKDASGHAVAGTWVQGISWVLTEDDSVPRLNAATALWYGCIQGEAAKLVQSNLAPDELAARAFAPCKQLEQFVEAEMKVADVPEGSVLTLKEQFRTYVRDYATNARKMLQTPP